MNQGTYHMESLGLREQVMREILSALSDERKTTECSSRRQAYAREASRDQQLSLLSFPFAPLELDGGP
jgi:hypothetical protein